VDAATLAVTPRVQRAEDLLRLVPGMLVIAHGAEGKGDQLFLRGFDAGHGQDVEILVEGLPINELSHVHGQGYVDLGFVVPETVLSLEALEGPFRVEQGNFATAGTVEYRLGVPARERGRRFKLDAGTTGRWRGLSLYAPPEGPVESFFAAEVMRDAGFGRNRRARRISVSGQAQLHDSAALGRLDVLAMAHQGHFGLPGAVRASEVAAGRQAWDGAIDDDTAGTSERALLALHHHVHPGGGRLETRLWTQWRHTDFIEDYTGFLLNPTEGDRRRQSQSGVSGGLRTRWHTPLATGLRLKLGADVQGESLDQSESGVREDHSVHERRRDLGVSQQAIATLGALAWRPMDTLRLEGGGRFDAFRYAVTDRLAPDRSGDDVLATASPRFTLAWDALEPLTLFAAYGRGFRAPEARSVTRAPGGEASADTRHEYYEGGEPHVTVADAAEVGLEVRPARTIRLSATGFGTFIDRELVFDHVSGLNLELNPTRRLGVAAQATWLPWPWLELRGDATAVDARFVRSGNPVPNAPTLLGTLQATALHPAGAQGALRVFHLGDRPLPFGARAGDVTLMDLTLGWRFSTWACGLGVDNLLDQPWRESEFMFASRFDPTAPRSTLPALHGVAGPGRVVHGSISLWL
jgi:outer membrane receptor protein involved in Fe transport